MSEIVHQQAVSAEEEWLDGWKKGPQRTRWTKLPPQVGDPAPDFDMVDQTGAQVKLSQYWQDQAALIIFWRHFGCSCGVDRASRLQAEYDDYVAAGGQVVVIGQGEPERSTWYAEKYGLPPVPLLSDPAFEVYEAFGLVEGKESQILFDAPDEFLRRDLEAGKKLMASRRDADRPLVDNSWLLPGEFVIDTDGIIQLTYRYNYCEDWPDHRVLVAALREARGDFN